MQSLTDNEQLLLLLTSHQRRLAGYVCTLVPNRADADEILQEVNLYICRNPAEFQLGTNFAAWALRIAHFRVLKWRERRTHDRLLFDDSLLERLADSARSLDARDDRYVLALGTCLRQLPTREHDLITELYSDPAATPQGLAIRFGRSAKGIYTSLKRIRLKLLECIERTLATEDHVT